MNSHDVDAALNADPNGWREPWRKHTSVLQEYVEVLREYIAELLQQIDTNVKEPPQGQNVLSEPQVSTSCSGNQDGTTGEKEPKPCPFCHAEVEFAPDELRPDGVWEHPRGNCIMQGTRITGDNVPDWNRRAPEPGTIDELSDTERQEAGYPATREELVDELRDCLELIIQLQHPSANAVIGISDREDRIRDILSREELND